MEQEETLRAALEALKEVQESLLAYSNQIPKDEEPTAEAGPIEEAVEEELETAPPEVQEAVMSEEPEPMSIISHGGPRKASPKRMPPPPPPKRR